MTNPVEELARFALYTLRSPRGAARELLQMNLAPAVAWTALALVCILSALMFHLTLGLLAAGDPAELGEIAASPFGTVLLSGMALLILVFGVHLVGRAFGGQGELTGAVVLVSWLQAIFLLLQAVQVLFMLTVPLLADVIGTLGLVLFFWLLAPFVTELHGFRSVWSVLFGIIGSAFAIALVLSLLLVTLAGA
ncbi:Yip1 family protein [Neotabrizicola shimadae]|uniref:YIP1 family protein n=1 Tax=Neotabrizicola shimadae TaxID=2807096 RepID=A0A8G0ZY11_9RHOB|nr:Yip1 family protein [Neotabrizicola shimadae]QYZ71001.1 YIP1 family protein [Neotabrizicola shimadae]